MGMGGPYLKMEAIILVSGRMIRSAVKDFLLDLIKIQVTLYKRKEFGIKVEN